MWAAALTCLCAGPSVAQDLVTVYEQAQHSDPVIHAARHALEAAREKWPQARAALLPNVAVTASKGRQQGQGSFNDAPFVDRSVNNWTWTLQLTQPLWRLGPWRALAEAEASVRQAEAQHAGAQQDLMLRVAKAYFDVLAAEDAVTVADAQIRAVQAQQVAAKRAFDVGTSTISDVHEAQARLDLALAQRVAALGDVDTRRAELDRMLGTPAGRLATLDATRPLPAPEPADAQSWISQARLQHPSVIQQSAALDAAEQGLRRQRAEHLPALDLTASRGTEFSSGTLSSPADIATRARSTRLGVQLTIPLFAGGATESRVRESAANRERARSELESAQRTAAMQARQAFTGVTTGLSQCEALVSAVASSRSALRANEVGYRTGTRINIDVLNAQQQLYAAQRDLAKARYETLMHGLRLKAAAGVLSPEDLHGVNAHLLSPQDVSGTTETPDSQPPSPPRHVLNTVP
ncbi:MAG: type I secretion protein TolC [Burkholderiales bacterium]|nr:MAG: type I secretion protein TolC [Burkholderiales bacterium]